MQARTPVTLVLSPIRTCHKESSACKMEELRSCMHEGNILVGEWAVPMTQGAPMLNAILSPVTHHNETEPSPLRHLLWTPWTLILEIFSSSSFKHRATCDRWMQLGISEICSNCLDIYTDTVMQCNQHCAVDTESWTESQTRIRKFLLKGAAQRGNIVDDWWDRNRFIAHYFGGWTL